MSYATVAATNAPPPSQQPHANPALLNTGRSPNLLPVDAHNEKVQIASPGFKEHPSTVTSEYIPPTDEELERKYGSTGPSSHRSHNQAEKDKHRRDKAKEHLHRAEHEAETAWEYAKTQILRPGVAGGILGIVNVGLLATAGYQFYTRPELRSDKRAIGGTVAGALILFGAEGWLAESYAQTEAGQREAQRAKEEGALIWKHTKEVVLRPGVLGGLVGVLNVGILGGLGYTFYSRPELQNDRRFISWVTIGVLSLFAGEGFAAEQYRK
ncbi:hypothetical protein AURDEDRAFT_108923 [Auricularia subglabra TFB-10046 SS5]|uniref:Uncharacterized protein n=1 Tax=Auricularia subglabra (strain TFB-10046 / SS5) TaxID=717982 RepID=J0WS11_AURST|nr:hypothetical protein AURDEDRAFT_108923 [Auricularia subglabra TFB-10046 SS5]